MGEVRQQSKRDVAKRMHERYLKAKCKADKTRLLDGFVELTGYDRVYARVLLKHGPPVRRGAIRRAGRPSAYGPQVVAALRVCAEATGWICGKRLVAILPELVPALEEEGTLELYGDERVSLLSMSSATIDRGLRQARRVARPKGVPTTKPGSLLKSQIPIRTYTPWDEQVPGFVEIDLVAHCGESAAGEFIYTLVVTDIATGWTECEPAANKGQAAVFGALEVIRARLPFPLLGIDSDNGSEFINAHLLGYCEREGITFTRCRAYHKDDQAHVEQKNYTQVRRVVGYDRLQGEGALEQLRAIYGLLRLHTNGWLPAMKLVSREREGGKTRKRYDEPRTPLRRVAGMEPTEARIQFERELGERGPPGLKRALNAEVEKLWRLRARAQAQASAVAL